MIDFNEQFNKVLAGLNTEQRKAVDAIQGPVMVIAGPGTGKTQILAARIGKILKETDAQPQSILCLTYTDAGAIAMQRRLAEFIGKDAYRVNISTFHGFCNTVIQEHPELFGKQGLDPVSDLERAQYYRELIRQFPDDHILKRFTGKVYFDVKPIRNLFETMSKENWSPEYVISKVDEYLLALPNREEFLYKRSTTTAGITYQKGDLKLAKIAEEQAAMDKLKAAVIEYEAFRQIMEKHNRYDFADMITWVIKALEERPDTLLLDYQERYQYILVDEYQDTNGSQNKLLQLLTAYENPNIFVVGDDDQSIYRFQGANIDNILTFTQVYEDNVNVIMLTENYRSVQPILDGAARVIDNNNQRLTKLRPGLSKLLRTAHNDLLDLHIEPTITEFANAAHEAAAIAQEIEQLYKDGYNLNEIAVIYTSHKRALELVTYLQRKQIPLNLQRKQNILELPLIEQLLDILRYVHAENTQLYSGEQFLYRIMHAPFFNIEPLDVAKLSVAVYKANFRVRETSWRAELKSILKNKKEDLFDSNTASITAMHALGLQLEFWIKDAMNCTLQTLLEKIITGAGILAYIVKSEDKVWLMQVLTTFFNFVKEETARNPAIKLGEFLEIIILMKDEQISIPLVQHIRADKGVNFVTAHSAKGLEFEKVYVIGCNEGDWEKNKHSASNNYKLPDTLFSLVTSDETEERRRLFYVALTRAKKYLHVSYVMTKNNKPIGPSRFISELEDASNLKTNHVQMPEAAVFNYQETLFESDAPVDIALLEKNYLDSLLDKFAMTVTNLNSYLNCRVAFYYQNVLRVPAPKNASMSFGTAVHGALDQFFKNMLKNPSKEFPAVNDLLNSFEWYMKRNQESFTQEEFKLRMTYGLQIIPDFYNQYINEWPKDVMTELSFNEVPFEGTLIRGRLDKVELHGNTVNVVDYKTGKYDNAKTKLKRPDPMADPIEKRELAIGGDYWRQAVFYKILVDNDKNRSWSVISTEFDFVEPDKKTKKYSKEKIMVTPEDIAIVKDQLVDSWKRIKNHEFSPGCGKDDCVWCNFQKQLNVQPVAGKEFALLTDEE